MCVGCVCVCVMPTSLQRCSQFTLFLTSKKKMKVGLYSKGLFSDQSGAISFL